MKTESRELLGLALTQVNDYAIVLIDRDGIIVDWLCGAQNIFGYSPQEATGKPISMIFVGEDLEKALDTYELEVAQKASYSQDDRWHVRQDSSRIWVSGTVTALRDDSGRLRGYVKIMRDRTDQRINSENRTNQLDNIGDAMDRTHLFLRTLGHEMRNPLAPIKTAAYITSRLSEDDRVQNASVTILNQVAVLERMATDMMDVARLKHTKLDLKLIEFDVRNLLEQETEGQLQAAKDKYLRLETVLPSHPVRLTADPDRLRQAVSNLVVNAVKYTPPGGRIWVKATQEADDVVIRVEDTGIGIAPAVLPRIFELFTRESRAEDLVPGGLGVGLAIVNQIAELHGGGAQARSAGEGKGAEFTLRLPRLGPLQADNRAQRLDSSSV